MPKRPTKIAVMDYVNCRVVIHNALIEDDSEVIEEFLSEKGYNMSNIYYMSGPEIPVEEINELS